MAFPFARAFFSLAALALLSFVASAQAADVTFPTGSKVGMAPPAGFTTSTALQGFDDRANSSAILILELPKQAFPEITKAMTAEGLKPQGVTVAKRENVTLKTGKGIFISGRQEAGGEKMRKWILVAETPELTAVVTALVPEDAAKVYPDAAMREAMLSLDVRASVPMEEQVRTLPFKLEDLASLRAFRVAGSTLFLTDGPKDEIEAAEQPLLVVSAAQGGPGDTAQRDMFARNLFGSVPGFTDLKVISTDLIRLSGSQTHQLLAEGKDAKTGDTVKFVQWLRFGNGAFVRFVGVARDEAWPAAFTRFRTVRDSLGPR